MTTTRFAFGENWQSFRESALDERRVEAATRSLRGLLGDLAGKRFLDVGCGSGIHSRAAHELGALVVSFDVDPESVACTRAVRGGARDWEVREGSALDDAFMLSLGTFDVVYAWGALHHTGDMWRAFDLAARAVGSRGLLAVAIYNRVHGRLDELSSESWRTIKRAYNHGSRARQHAMLAAYVTWRIAVSLTKLENPLREARGNPRGMSWLHDARDWVGGFPYEFATADEVEHFASSRGFVTRARVLAPPNGWGNNELVFARR